MEYGFKSELEYVETMEHIHNENRMSDSEIEEMINDMENKL